MNRSHRSVWLAVFAAALLYLQVDHTAAQQVGLVALDTNEVAKGYRAEALKLRPANNDKGETIGKITTTERIWTTLSCRSPTTRSDFLNSSATITAKIMPNTAWKTL